MKKKIIAIARVAVLTISITQTANVTAFNLTSHPIARTLIELDTTSILGGNFSTLSNGYDDL